MNELLTLREVANILRVGPEAVRLWIRDGIFQAIRTPGRTHQLYRVKRETIEDLLNTPHKEEGVQP